MIPSSSLANDSILKAWRCDRCSSLMQVPNENEIELTDRVSGERSSLLYCDDCWPLVQARLLVLLGLAGEA